MSDHIFFDENEFTEEEVRESNLAVLEASYERPAPIFYALWGDESRLNQFINDSLEQINESAERYRSNDLPLTHITEHASEEEASEYLRQYIPPTKVLFQKFDLPEGVIDYILSFRKVCYTCNKFTRICDVIDGGPIDCRECKHTICEQCQCDTDKGYHYCRHCIDFLCKDCYVEQNWIKCPYCPYDACNNCVEILEGVKTCGSHNPNHDDY